LAIPGVGEVNRQGGVDREIRVEIDPDRLAALGVTAAQVSQALVSANSDLPGGRVTVAGSERAIRIPGAAGSLEELRETRIPLSGGGSVRLGDLGRVEDAWTEPRAMARHNGQQVVTFNMLRSREASEVKVAERVREVVAEMDEAHPELEIQQITANVEYIEESYLASIEALLIGAALAVLVVFLFLRDIRATIIAAVALPLSLIPTFAVLSATGQSLNGVTLLALSLTIGILVDDAIVEIENIVRHMRGGKSPYDAAIEAADGIGLAVVATTSTIIAVFAPVGFMPGIIGQFFIAFALAACVAVFFSLVVARMLTPLMGAYLLRHSTKLHDADPFWMKPYLRALHWVLGNRWKVFGAGIAIFIGSIVLGMQVPAEPFPAGDQGRASLSVELPPGATLQETDAVAQQVTSALLERPEVESVYASVEVASARVVANLVDKGDRELSQQAFVRTMVDQLRDIPGARIGAGGGGGGGPGDGTKFSLSLLSDNGAALEAHASRVEQQMRGV